MDEWLRGPLLYAALAVSAAGLVWQGLRFRHETRAVPPPARPASAATAPRAGRFLGALRRLGRGPLLTWHPGFAALTFVFHVLLIGLPFAVAGHTALVGEALGLALPGLTAAAGHALTLVVCLLAAWLIGRRLLVRRVRVLTRPGDLLAWALTAAPFVTGYLAHAGLVAAPLALRLHILAGEALLVALPFTRLSHALFFLLYRGTLGGEHGFGRRPRRAFAARGGTP